MRLGRGERGIGRKSTGLSAGAFSHETSAPHIGQNFASALGRAKEQELHRKASMLSERCTHPHYFSSLRCTHAAAQVLYEYYAPAVGKASYSELDVDAVLKTVDALSRRVVERFPDAGLRGVCKELQSVGEAAREDLRHARQPIWPIRIGTVAVLGFMLAFVAVAFANIRITDDTFNLTNLVDVVQNIVQDFVWLGLAVYFLVRIEATVKRKRVLRMLHRLRSIAHVIDMHQLTKDPYRLTSPEQETASSPTTALTPFLLLRYLDYCSEMLSLTGKIAALYLRDFDDSGVVAAVTEVEELTSGLSQKIWQKISSIPADA
jgi:hypothetical protein